MNYGYLGPKQKVFLQYEKVMGIHPERIEDTKVFMRKLWDVTQNIGQQNEIYGLCSALY